MKRRSLASAAILSLVAACGSSDAPQGTDAAGAAARVLKAETALPPGQSGFFSAAGQLQGSVSQNPADYGAHVDDQRLMYWGFDAKPGALGTRPGTPESPKDGVQIYRDGFGVPIVYAGTVRDGWFGVGYAVAQDRLFLMDAVRRMGAGTFAELTGCGSVPADIQQRTLAYSDAEYEAIFDRLSADAKDAVLGYVDGANAWRENALADPSLLPAEYALLTTVPAEFTVKDVLAAGVFITRFVAAEGGNERLNVEAIRQLEVEYGSREEAYRAFLDMTWLDDPQAVVSVPREAGTFSNQAAPTAGREAAFRAMA
ncbi:MAG: penicillin acylase family protein, partial [Gammaproteobacteria bacterium]